MSDYKKKAGLNEKSPLLEKKMIKIHCGQMGEFVRIYVFDWHVLSALAVPVIFSIFFPIYWFVICPQVWTDYPEYYEPRSFLIGYWMFALMVWLVFLAICFYKTRTVHESDLGSGIQSGHKRSASTEDLWSEDHYLPQYLPEVSVNAVQPDVDSQRSLGEEPVEPPDETWDYDYEPTSCASLTSPGYQRFPLEQHYHSLGYLNAKLQQQGEIWRKHSESSYDFGDGRQYRSSEFTTTDDDMPPPMASLARLQHPRPSFPPRFAHTRRSSSRHLRPGSSGSGSRYFRRGRIMSGSTTSTGSTDSTTADRQWLVKQRRGPHPGAIQRPRPASQVVSTRPKYLDNSGRKHNALARHTVPLHQSNPGYRSLDRLSSQSPLEHYQNPGAPQRSMSQGDGGPYEQAPLIDQQVQASCKVPEEKLESYKETMTDDEYRSLQDVCRGKIARSNSLVSDSKFDSILASLQSLASELEKDFSDGNCSSVPQSPRSPAKKSELS